MTDKVINKPTEENRKLKTKIWLKQEYNISDKNKKQNRNLKTRIK